MGHGFPRRYISVTPQEVLYDHDRVLGARVKMTDTGKTILRQPRLETTAYTQITEMGNLVQIRRQEGKSVVLDNAFLQEPFRYFATELVIIGMSTYLFLNTPYKVMKAISLVAGVNSLIQVARGIYELSRDPEVAYQKVNPSVEV